VTGNVSHSSDDKLLSSELVDSEYFVEGVDLAADCPFRVFLCFLWVVSSNSDGGILSVDLAAIHPFLADLRESANRQMFK